MNTLSNTTIFDEIALNNRPFSEASVAFFDAWKQGVELIAPALFGDGTRKGFDLAVDKWELCPNLPAIRKAIGVMSSSEKKFLAAMVSFYNSNHGGKLFKRVGIHGLADLGGLDLQHRKVIAALIVNYSGW